MPYKFNPFTGTFDDSTAGPAGTVSAAGSGTAALPGIAFASDPNTGIYSPGADQLAVATNGNACAHLRRQRRDWQRALKSLK
jgi:hypothetical protein